MPAEKKQILIFLDWYLPGYKAGGPVQSCSSLVERLKDDFAFSIVARDTDYMETSPYPSVQRNGWNERADDSRVYYISQEKLGWKTINKIIKEVEPDVLYLNSMFSLYFTLVPLLLAKRKKIKKIIVAPRGMLATGALSVKSGKKAVFLSISRTLDLFSGVLFHATSAQEIKDIQNVFGLSAQVLHAQNLTSSSPSLPEKRLKQKGVLRLVSLARIAPEKNILFTLQVLEGFSRQMNCQAGAVQLDLFGTVYDESYWKQCREIVERIKDKIPVTYRNSLEPGNIHSTLAAYDFLFMPSRGENFGHAIVQALQSGTPVIVSDKTPWQNLEQQEAGWDIPLEEPDKFIAVLKNALDMDADGYKRLSAGALSFAQKATRDKETKDRYLQLFS